MSLDQILMLPPGYGFDSAAWAPSSISSLVAWWSAGGQLYSDAGTTPVVDTDPIYRAKARNTASFPADQTTLGNRPIYTANSGNPYMAFTGASSHYLNCGNSATLNPTSGMSLFVRFQPGGANGFVVARDDNAAGRSYSFGQISSKIYFEVNGTAVFNTGAVTSGNTYTMAVTGNAGDGWKSYINNSNIGSAAWVAPASSTANVNLGRRSYSGAENYLTGRIEEVLLFNDAIDAATLTLLETYFT